MRLAVFSDVHGNLAALEAVLSDMARQSVDKIVFAGDLCFAGPRPAACLERVRGLDCPAVFGNTDDWILGRQQAPNHLAELTGWTNQQLDSAQRSWLDSLPFSHSISPTVNAAESLLIVHANPLDVNQLIFPAEEEQVTRYGRIRQPDSGLDDLLSGSKSRIVIFGHLHIPSIRYWKELSLFNISSVSMAGDGDPRAKYGLFSWENNSWSFERQVVSYDSASEIAAYRLNKPPGWQTFVDAIVDYGTVPQKV